MDTNYMYLSRNDDINTLSRIKPITHHHCDLDLHVASLLGYYRSHGQVETGRASASPRSDAWSIDILAR